MQDFNNAVFFALVLNILTTFPATFLAFGIAETLQLLQKGSNLTNA